jgi:hypothetical protein
MRTIILVALIKAQFGDPGNGKLLAFWECKA